jgi:hypothetical protein
MRVRLIYAVCDAALGSVAGVVGNGGAGEDLVHKA